MDCLSYSNVYSIEQEEIDHLPPTVSSINYDRITINHDIASLISVVTIHAKIPIGLKPFASGRGLILGAAVQLRSLQGKVDDGRYRSYFDQNFQMIVPGSELMLMHIWKGENQYNFNDSD